MPTTHNAEPLVAAVDKLVERKPFAYVPAHNNLPLTNPSQSFDYVKNVNKKVSQVVETIDEKLVAVEGVEPPTLRI